MKPTPADPDAWNAYLAEGNAIQARKHVSAAVHLRDEQGRPSGDAHLQARPVTSPAACWRPGPREGPTCFAKVRRWWGLAASTGASNSEVTSPGRSGRNGACSPD